MPDDVVTLARFTSQGVVGSLYGRDPEVIARYLADGLVRHAGWEIVYTVGFAPGTSRPLLVLSPMVARTLARTGLSKADLRALLFQHARVPASRMRDYYGLFTSLVPGSPPVEELARRGKADAIFAEGSDPARLVPIVARPEHIQIVVSGDPLRSNAAVLGSNGMHGFPTSKRVRWG